MPLVHEFTGEIRRALRGINLRSANRNWRRSGAGFAESVIDDLLDVISRPGVTYENALGFLQIQYSRHGGHGVGQDYAGLFAWLSDLVYQLLYQRHVLNYNYIKRQISRFAGIRELAKDSTLWVFSLNQDLLVEFMAQEWSIPFASGFSNEVHEITVKDQNGLDLGTLPVRRIIVDELDEKPLEFLCRGEAGINLFKVHGSLDSFLVDDAKQMLKLAYPETGGASVLEQLALVNERLSYEGPPRVTNHIMYFDEDGVLRFFRKALITGVEKFKKHHLLQMPKRILELSRHHLNYVTHLAVIGYSFGDVHINEILQDWLQFSRERRISIVNPGQRGVPQFLGHLADQVSIEEGGASDYFGQFSSEQPATVERLAQALLDPIRRWRSQRLANEQL